MAKKLTALLLAAAIIITVFTACSKQENESAETTTAVQTQTNYIPEDDSTFKLSYTQSDSLNPYDAVTLNNQLVDQLVFEGLFSLDESYKSSLNIAESYKYTSSSKLEVTIPSGLTFSDGSALTADDITYSFRKAAASDYWAGTVSGISSCTAASSTTVVFNLKQPNSYAQNLLTFPIISSAGGSYPIGSGRYYFADDNGETVLKARVTDSFKPYLTTIHLENITSSESIDNAVNIGNISFAFRDLSSDSTRKITSNKKLVNMNNLVFIGVNNKSGITANAYIRRAISSAVDRETLVKSAYNGFAQATPTVFNPKFELANTEIFEKTADINAAKQAIAQSGISNLSLSLLVNGDNADRVVCAKMIEQQLEAAGFNVNIVTAESYEKYIELIQNESFNLYLGEIRLTADMSLQPFFSSDGSAYYGISLDECSSAQQYNAYLNGDAELGAFLLAFSDEMPYIPLLYRKGMICFSKAMNGDVQGTCTDCFANIKEWYFKSE